MASGPRAAGARGGKGAARAAGSLMTLMSLRTLDLRGTPPPFEAVLPRPSAPGSDVHDVVAGILRQVRAEGDEALVRYTAELDKVDVSDGLRVPAVEIEKARADADPDLWRALEVAYGRIVAYHAHEATPL